MLGRRTPVEGREISDFQVAVIFLFVGPTCRQLHNKEELVELLDVLALHHDRRHHFVRSRNSHTHFLPVLGLTENTIPLQVLCQVRDHVCFEICLTPLVFLYHDCHLLGDVVADGRMQNFVVLLHFGCSADFFF